MMAWCMTARIDYFKTVNDITVFKCLEFDAPKTGVDFDVNSEQAINTRLKMFAEISNKQQWVKNNLLIITF
jgi:hypothetical protein